MDFGSHGNIDIRYNADDWGPYRFNLEEKLPGTDVLSSVKVRSFSEASTGKVKPSSTYASPTGYGNLTETTASLIDSDYTPQIISDYYVYVKFVHPGNALKGVKHTLLFEIETDSGAKHSFYFHSVKTH